MQIVRNLLRIGLTLPTNDETGSEAGLKSEDQPPRRNGIATPSSAIRSKISSQISRTLAAAGFSAPSIAQTWSDAVSQRFSIIPARAIIDKNLTDLDVRVLGVFGIHADTETGWCFKNQSKIAEQLGVARQSVSRSCNRLYAAGYVEARDINAGKSTKGLRSINCYRIILDSKAEPPQSVIDALSPCGDNDEPRCLPGETTVVTPGRQLNVPLRTVEEPPNPLGGFRAKIDQAEEDEAPPIPAAPIATQAAHSDPHSQAFVSAWRTYPGTDKAAAGPQAAAWRTWQAEGCDAIGAAVLVGIRRYAEAATRPNAPNVQHMHRWLSKRRWEGVAMPAAPIPQVAAVAVVEAISAPERARVGSLVRDLAASLKAGR